MHNDELKIRKVVDNRASLIDKLIQVYEFNLLFERGILKDSQINVFSLYTF